MVCVGVDAYLNNNFVSSTNFLVSVFSPSLWLECMSKCGKFEDQKAYSYFEYHKTLPFILAYTTVGILSILRYLKNSLSGTHFSLSLTHSLSQCVLLLYY